MHVESGFYGNFAAGYMKDDAINTDPGFKPWAIPDDRSSFYAFESASRRSGMNWARPPSSASTITMTADRRTDSKTVTHGFAWNDLTATTDGANAATASKTVTSSRPRSSPSG